MHGGTIVFLSFGDGSVSGCDELYVFGVLKLMPDNWECENFIIFLVMYTHGYRSFRESFFFFFFYPCIADISIGRHVLNMIGKMRPAPFFCVSGSFCFSLLLFFWLGERIESISSGLTTSTR